MVFSFKHVIVVVQTYTSFSPRYLSRDSLLSVLQNISNSESFMQKYPATWTVLTRNTISYKHNSLSYKVCNKFC